MKHSITIALAVFSLAAPTHAQNEHDPQAGFTKACEKMRKLASVEFASLEIQTNNITKQVGSQDIEVEGTWSAGVVQANLNLGEDQVIISNGRLVTRREDGAWKLRRNALTNGEPVPFVLDPKLFFDLLVRIPDDSRRVLHNESTTYRGRELEIYSISLAEEAARDFALGGALPPISAGMSGMMLRFGRGSSSAPDITLDLAFYVDPETNLIHRIKAKAYQASSMGNVQFRIAGAGGAINAGVGDEEEEEQVEEIDDAGNPQYKKGLRVRKIDDSMSVMEFDVRLSEHGKSFALALDQDTRTLLSGR